MKTECVWLEQNSCARSKHQYRSSACFVLRVFGSACDWVLLYARNLVWVLQFIKREVQDFNGDVVTGESERERERARERGRERL